MSQANGEAPVKSGLFGWLKSLVRKDPAPATGGTVAGTTTTSTPTASAATTALTTAAAPVTPTTQRGNSRKRIAAEDALQATFPPVAASRPDSPAVYPLQQLVPSPSPSQSQPQSQSQAINLLRAQTWISDGQCTQPAAGAGPGIRSSAAGSPRLDAVEDCQGDLGRWPDSPRQERPGRVQPAARNATLLSAPLDSPRTRVYDTMYEKTRPSGGHTAVEMLDPRSIQQSFVKARMANGPGAVPTGTVLPATPRNLADRSQQVPFPHSADDLRNGVDPAIAAAAATTGRPTFRATVPWPGGDSGGGGYDSARTAAADGVAGGGGSWAPSLRPTVPTAAAAAGPSRSRLSGTFPATVNGYGSGVQERAFGGIPAVTSESATGGPQRTTTTTTKSSSTNHSSKSTTNGPDGTIETTRKSSVKEQSSRKVMHQVSKPGEDLDDDDGDDEGDDDGDLEDLGQGEGGGRLSSAVRGRQTAAAAATVTDEWPEPPPGARLNGIGNCREQKDVISLSRHRQEQSEETTLQRGAGGGGAAATAAGAGPEIITTTTRRESRREEQEEFQKVVSSSSRGLVVEERRQAYEEEKREMEERREVRTRAPAPPGSAAATAAAASTRSPESELGSRHSFYSTTRTSMHVKTSSKVTLSTQRTAMDDPTDLMAAVAAASQSRAFMGEDSAYGIGHGDEPATGGSIALAALSGRGRVPNYYPTSTTVATGAGGGPFIPHPPPPLATAAASRVMSGKALLPNRFRDSALTEEDLAKVSYSQSSCTARDSRADILERFLGDAHGTNGRSGSGGVAATPGIHLVAPPMTPGARSTASAASFISAAVPVAPIFEANLAAAEAAVEAEAARFKLAGGNSGRGGDGYSSRPLSRVIRRGCGADDYGSGAAGCYSPSWGRGTHSRQQAAAAATAAAAAEPGTPPPQSPLHQQQAKHACSHTNTTTTQQNHHHHHSSTLTHPSQFRNDTVVDGNDGVGGIGGVGGGVVQQRHQQHQQQSTTTTTMTETIRRTSKGQELRLQQQQQQQQMERREEEELRDGHHRHHHQEATTTTTTTTTTSKTTTMKSAIRDPGALQGSSSIRQSAAAADSVFVPPPQQQLRPMGLDAALHVERETLEEDEYGGEEDEQWNGIGASGGGRGKNRHRRHRRVRIASAWRNGGTGGASGVILTGSSGGGGYTTDGEDGVSTSLELYPPGASSGGGGGGGGSTGAGGGGSTGAGGGGSQIKSFVSRSGKSGSRISPSRNGAHRANSGGQGGLMGFGGLGGMGGTSSGWDSGDPDMYDKYDTSSRALAAQAQLMRGAGVRSRNPGASVAALIVDTSALNPLTWQSGTSPSSACGAAGGGGAGIGDSTLVPQTASLAGVVVGPPSRRHQSSPGSEDVLLQDGGASGIGCVGAVGAVGSIGSRRTAGMGIGVGGTILRPPPGALSLGFGAGFGAGGVGGGGGSLYHRANMGLAAGLSELAAGLAGLGGGGSGGGFSGGGLGGALATARRMREPTY